jgi:hypothetical protein
LYEYRPPNVNTFIFYENIFTKKNALGIVF